MEKKTFSAVEIEIVKLDKCDIIAASTCGPTDFEGCPEDFENVGGECTSTDCLTDF